MKRHARENYDKAVDSVQEIERRMLIQERWTSEGNDWKDAAELTSNRRYRRAVDNLEFLVLKRLFELTKMNKSGLGKVALWENDNLRLINWQDTRYGAT